MPLALGPIPVRGGSGGCLVDRAHHAGMLGLGTPWCATRGRKLLWTGRNGLGYGQGPHRANSLALGITGALAGLAVARETCKSRLPPRGHVALAAKASKAKKKKGKGKGGANQAAVQKALAAMQMLEQQAATAAAEKTAEATAGDQRPTPSATSKDGDGTAQPVRPEHAQDETDPVVRPSKQSLEPQAATAPAISSDAQKKAATANADNAHVDAPAEESAASPSPAEMLAVQTQESSAQEIPDSPVMVEPDSKGTPEKEETLAEKAMAPAAPDAKPRPRSALQDAFAALGDTDTVVPKSSPSVQAERKSAATSNDEKAARSDDPLASDDLFAAFIAPSPDAPSNYNPSDDALAAFLAPRPAPPPVKEESREESSTASEPAEDGLASSKATAEVEDDDDDDDEDRPMLKRRRGEGDFVSFEMETGGLQGMVAVGLRGVQARLGGRQILQDASWVVRTGDRMALVGANGCGKTTQLNVLTGALQPEEGEVVMNRPDLKLALLSQGFVDELDPERTLEEELLSAVPREAQVLKALANVQTEIEKVGAESEEGMKLIDRLTELQDQAEQLRAYDLDGRMNSILDKVGFLPEDLKQKVDLFSGGWKVRIGLSKIFMTAPDVLLLDEPTNHLDLESVEWIEEFLQKQGLPIVLVSHDREFMDRVCNRVVETVEGMTYTYKGNYTDYLKQRDEKMSNWRKKYALQEKQVKELEDFIKVNRGKQSLSNARNNKIAELEKLRASDKWLDPPPKYARKIKFHFPEPPKGRRGGRQVTTLAEVHDLTHGYGEGGDSMLFKEASFAVGAGEKIGVVGRNGSGKSTLLRILMGTEKPSQDGYVMPADPEKTRYFTQHQADLLPPDLSAFEVVMQANEILMDEDELLGILKKFRFKGDRLKVLCKDLSGGEKARLAIVRMMLSPAQLLIFDEPTNHLDVPMKETLEYSLREFGGAVVVVSHDRWFLSQTCENIVALTDNDITRYAGDFRHYMDSNPETKRKIENHYTRDSRGIGSLPYSRAERRKRERGGLRKNMKKRQARERKEMLEEMRGIRRRR